MIDYQKLIDDLRNKSVGSRNEAADAIEALVRDIDVLTKELDAAVTDLKNVLSEMDGMDFCLYCMHREVDGQCFHHCIPYSCEWGWEWRGAPEVLK